MVEKLNVEKYFHEKGDVYENVGWRKTNIEISDENGETLFIQEGIEVPEFYSELGIKIIASRYFYGEGGTEEREGSIRTLIKRVSDKYPEWARKQEYMDKESAENFRNEIAYLTLNQMMAFNSPVWFNVGTDKYKSRRTEEQREEYGIVDGKIDLIPYEKIHEYPQTSACFIQSVGDTLEEIMDLAKKEALLFRYGSGTGTDLSTLRSSREKLSGGGTPSGPLAYEIFYSDVAGIVKSGGKTRRAAKMNSLKVTHPDIKEFIVAKTKEQKNLECLMDYAGLTYDEAAETVSYQNANFSVRVNDEFMSAYENDEEWQTVPVNNKELADDMPKYKARELIRLIAEGTWACGDPGLQFDTTINNWHTCPNAERINASNPCSEYMFIDDSSCNLASFNLMGFMGPDKIFNVKDFGKAIRITAFAMDLNIDNSSFPTKKIAENSYKFRPLGIGYANLGALLMYLGLPYDSDEARASAATITALMTGKVYETSTEMAEKIGVFEEFENNKEPMLKIIEKHRSALENIDRNKLPKGLEKVLDEAETTWDNVIKRGEIYGFRNAQATVLAPTGTIGFMMDCATKGVEPELGLVQYKLLAEGGTLKIVNYSVGAALENLGYTEKQKDSIMKYIEENETVEGSPDLMEEHLAIFDCANKPENGTRTISPIGHIKMMAAVQPFLSGSISKTVNLPKEVTVEEIENIYVKSWKLGLKAVALYRDGSKRGQPLSFKKNLESKVGQEIVRRKLPTTAPAIRHKFDIGHHEGYFHIGLYEDGQPGELFITMSKEGSTIGGLMDTVGTLTSLALQHGVPLETLVKKFKNQRFEPYGIIWEGREDIKTATSIIDYIFTALEKQFCNQEDKEPDKIEVIEVATKENEKDSQGIIEQLGGFCPICGSRMMVRGHCEEKCINPKCNFVNLSGCGE